MRETQRSLCIALTMSGLAIMQTVAFGWDGSKAPLHWDDYRFVYDAPIAPEKDMGRVWEQSAPIGNGHLGARISGAVGSETIFVNLASYWSGKPYNNLTPEAKAQLPAIRKAVAESNWAKADAIAAKYFTGPHALPSLGVGSLELTIEHAEGYHDYKRVFNLDEAYVKTTYTVDDVVYTKQAFVSHPDRVMAIRVAADKPGALNCTVTLDGLTPHTVNKGQSNEMVLAGSAERDNKGMRFQCRLKAINAGGRVAVENEVVTVEDATSVVFLLTGATSFNGPLKDPETEGVDEKQRALDMMRACENKRWNELLTAHIKDHQRLFRTFYLELGGRHKPKPGATQKGIDDQQPHALVMQFGRYLLIAGSRADSPTPMTLQGMWSYTKTGPWQNAYHLNENVQKQYHFAEATGLPETQEPVYKFIKALAIKGQEVATVNYGLDGWCAHHQSDIWAAAGLRSKNPAATLWPFGGVFLSQILWRHYEFSQDKEFLAAHYPEMKGCALFLLDWLVQRGDTLVTSPSTSPENRFWLVDGEGKFGVTYATTCDMTLTRQSLKDCRRAAEILNADPQLRKTISQTLDRLYPYPIGKTGRFEGRLLEWPEEFKSNWGHRHASGLLGLWSGSEITMQHTPKLWKAAKKCLPTKNKHPGTAIMCARGREGDKAISCMRDKLFPQRWQPTRASGAIPEMLLQSHAGEIDILPALPTVWPSGRVEGIRAQGGFTLSIQWQDHKATKVLITSEFGNPVQVRCPGAMETVVTQSGKITAKRISPDVIAFPTARGKTYALTLE